MDIWFDSDEEFDKYVLENIFNVQPVDREAYQIIKLFKQGDLSRQEAESQLLALGFSEDLIKKRLDEVF